MIKKLIYLVGSLLFLLLVTFLAGNKLLAYAVRQQLDAVPQAVADLGIEVSDPAFQSLVVASSRSIRFRNVGLRFRLTAEEHFDTSTTFVLRVAELKISATDYSYNMLTLEAEGIRINSRDSLAGDIGSGQSPLRSLGSISLQGRLLRTSFPSDPAEPGVGLRQHLFKLGEYLTTGSLPVPVEFDGEVIFTLGQRTFPVAVTSVEEQGIWTFKVKREALEPVAAYFKDQLTPLELELMINNPLRAPIIAASKEFVNTKVQELPPPISNKERDAVPPETYRYVLWGYVLAKLTGPEFAQKVADAHNGSAIKSPEHKKSDRENFALGKRYAAENVALSALPALAAKEGSIASQRATWTIK